MYSYKVVEKFVSINGEGPLSGQLAVFIRFKECNLNCSYCDTLWANGIDTPYVEMSAQEIYDYIKETHVNNVTLTGGEPLLREGMEELLSYLGKDNVLNIEIETNGSIDIGKYINLVKRPSFTMDYKLPSSNMENEMLLSNFEYLNKSDTVKFVAGNFEDLEKAKDIIDKYKLVEKCRVYMSTVFGKIKLEEVVDYMKENNLNGVNLQIQMHKIIWNPNERGV